ncbi:hypothetical protein AALO_G00222490 [Alosa alosa]|uniref:Uncharacterized protein n=1 Tax=Alosa alosa TaxID=278164 RepID=A0AAV6G4G3_9TELE|nr:hypothetical protein AALO_G00222490 [Alosa alosa]
MVPKQCLRTSQQFPVISIPGTDKGAEGSEDDERRGSANETLDAASASLLAVTPLAVGRGDGLIRILMTAEQTPACQCDSWSGLVCRQGINGIGYISLHWLMRRMRVEMDYD